MTVEDNNTLRYQRQARFAPLGEDGQNALMKSRVLICGCGALGTVIAETLVRAGVGFVRIVDRDFVEIGNIHRQVLFTEDDAKKQLPKAVAAASRLLEINSEVDIEPVVADVNYGNIDELASDVDLLMDGTDNFETRFLINDFAVSKQMPWIFAGCVGAEGQTLVIVPGETPCLACIMPEPPPAAATPTCESSGVLAPIVNVMASLQAIEAIKFLSGNRDCLNPKMTVVDLWNNTFRAIAMRASRNPDCGTCGRHDYAWLRGDKGSAVTRLCGRNSVQISPTNAESFDLEVLAGKLRAVSNVVENKFLVRFNVEGYVMTVFADGRTIVGGTDDLAIARTMHAKYVGN